MATFSFDIPDDRIPQVRDSIIRMHPKPPGDSISDDQWMRQVVKDVLVRLVAQGRRQLAQDAGYVEDASDIGDVTGGQQA